ncbi:hypothetical protein COW36_00860 [bacterium (Candidatus Blackallbacteria) CG17_big_fil_post_rev_8_21_14_2_50_48_46]|uniref:Actin-like protein N-terminal domain-containing protein n=1 Tax=bacterium (Candidatus Blackallbacteria) CG17_big_fil_post_rev_8_21_14_2_50_48_46 TaxID=2014261 RepID=A0A2M7GB53_9BACT|nr:MAG: hypothetical protein COW64_10315 [bacterium (Candidatus Blackallbacteria) CG18_big_fil_WC_8_21_14_2_50_49_26]PIW19419.1 MAG: hypothetical protein COW36_00860 [bacterium (Candidatus Blackallbacteria) CG17_big_fil_post_rev_8_21_14_2_50_48_46]PIW48977.1 MAG: hypothetical protein COW20_07595 [bacterium (Candidatus Blackallbacteria) CG13_big_fil_rev_8_21_14_2_50_49_14]
MVGFSFRREQRCLGLWFSPEEALLVDREHGLIAREAACLVRPVANNKPLIWGNSALLSGKGSPLWQMGWQPQEIKSFLQSFIATIIPLSRCQLLLPVLNLGDAYYSAFWHLLRERLNLASLSLCSPLSCLAHLTGIRSTDLILFIEEGLAECSLGAPLHPPLAVGYGRYLSRRLMQYVFQQYGLKIDSLAAGSAWQRLGGLAQVQDQLTLKGVDREGKIQYQMITAEELAPLAEAAFQPLVNLCRLQLEQQFSEPKQKVTEVLLFGEQADLPGLAAYLQNQLCLTVSVRKSGPDIMVKALQEALQSKV